MPSVDLVISTALSSSTRARQVCSMFDVPPEQKCVREWHGDLPIDERDWNVGLVVGPSGSGKSSIMRQLWGNEQKFEWSGASVLDDFDESLSIDEIASACNAVGFSTIPAWLRPFHVLSNGEQFRADLARRLVELPDPVVVDEFTSVVDRQVAQIGSHAVQKWARRNGRRFVAVTCHYDVIDWLQPDWILEPDTMAFRWRSLRRRPEIAVRVERIAHGQWQRFAPFHYLTGELSKAARCFGLFVEGIAHPVAFCGVLHRPHPTAHDVMGVSRLVTLPDWQGIGLAFVLVDKIGAAFKAVGKRLHTYPAHPPFIRAFGRTPRWTQVKSAGLFSPAAGSSSTVGGFGGRPCAVFRYDGEALELDVAEALLDVSADTLRSRERALRLRRKPARLRRGRK